MISTIIPAIIIRLNTRPKIENTFLRSICLIAAIPSTNPTKFAKDANIKNVPNILISIEFVSAKPGEMTAMITARNNRKKKNPIMTIDIMKDAIPSPECRGAV